MEKGQTECAIDVSPRAATTGTGSGFEVSPRETTPMEASICKKYRSIHVKGETWRKDRLDVPLMYRLWQPQLEVGMAWMYRLGQPQLGAASMYRLGQPHQWRLQSAKNTVQDM